MDDYSLTPSSIVYRLSYFGSSRRNNSSFHLFPAPDLAFKFVAKRADRIHHRALHLLHLLAHRQDHLNPGEVHTKLARKSQDHLKLLHVLLGIEPRIPFAPLGLDEPLALVDSQRLRVNAEHFRDHADHKQSVFTNN